MKSFKILLAAMSIVFAGCVGYRWTSPVPEKYRTVSVPTFRNESEDTELGSVVTRQLLREFQREGTMKIVRDDAAIEVQGVIKSTKTDLEAYSRATGARNREHSYVVNAEVSFIDRLTGRVLVENRRYSGVTTFLAHDDLMTGKRDAAGRAAEMLAREIVDDVTSLPLNKE